MGTDARFSAAILAPVPDGAEALPRRLAAAREAGHTHALTLDGELDVSAGQIDRLLALARSQPQSLILCSRPHQPANQNALRRLWQRLRNHLLRLACGVHLRGPQSAVRIYPLELVDVLKCRDQGRGYQTEIIARAGWAGCPIEQIELAGMARPAAVSRTSAQRMLEGMGQAWLHGRLLLRALAPWPHRQWAGRTEPASGVSVVKSTLAWVSPRDAWRQLRHDESGRTMFATGLAVGVFIGNLPIYGLQTVAALYAARKLHLHPVSVVAGTQVSMPPVAFGLIAAALYVGHFIMHGRLLTLPAEVTAASIAAMAPGLLAAWSIGSVLVGLAMAAVTFVGAVGCFRLVLPRGRLQAVPVPANAVHDRSAGNLPQS